MADMSRIYSGFSKEDWHSEPVQEIVLCLAFLALGCRLFRGCDASIELRGQLSPINYPQPISLKCWFPVGALRAYSLRQSRQPFVGVAVGGPRTQPLSLTPTSALNDPRPLNLLGGHSTVSGSLDEGVTLTLQKATCVDAGVYTCEFEYKTMENYVTIDKTTARSATLHLYPDFVECKSNPGYVDFVTLKDNPVTLSVRCTVRTTVEVKWVWVSRREEEGSSWISVPKNELYSEEPGVGERCQKPWISLLSLPVTREDRNRQFRVHVLYSEGASRVTTITLRDLRDLDPGSDYLDTVMGLQQVLAFIGWALLSTIFITIVVLLMSMALYPRVRRLRSVGALRRLRLFTNLILSRNNTVIDMPPEALGQGGDREGEHRQQHQQQGDSQSTLQTAADDSGGVSTTQMAQATTQPPPPPQSHMSMGGSSQTLGREVCDMVGAETMDDTMGTTTSMMVRSMSLLRAPPRGPGREREPVQEDSQQASGGHSNSRTQRQSSLKNSQ